MINILFAHPDRKLSQIYTQHIQPHFSVDSAFDGLTALRRLRTGAPSLVVSDYHLPLISGLSLLRFIRAHRDFHMMPFVFLSDYDDNTEALSMGANDWLETKSIQPDLLIDRIYYHLKNNKHALQIR